jgi:hypothetical protein
MKLTERRIASSSSTKWMVRFESAMARSKHWSLANGKSIAS